MSKDPANRRRSRNALQFEDLRIVPRMRVRRPEDAAKTLSQMWQRSAPAAAPATFGAGAGEPLWFETRAAGDRRILVAG